MRILIPNNFHRLLPLFPFFKSIRDGIIRVGSKLAGRLESEPDVEEWFQCIKKCWLRDQKMRILIQNNFHFIDFYHYFPFLVYPRRNNPGGLEAGGPAGVGAGRGGVVPVHRRLEQCRHTQTVLKGMYIVHSLLIVPFFLLLI